MADRVSPAGTSGDRKSSSRSPERNTSATQDSPTPAPAGISSSSQIQDLINQGLLHGNAHIEAGGSDEDGEFSADSITFDSESEFQDEDDGSVSLRTSLYEHSYANGRRYHRYRHGRYPIPNDEQEQSREDMLHTMMLEATDGRLFYAPLGHNVQKIIDLGTGTGLWAIEIGEMFPSAEVMGLDLSPIQPPWVPPNVKFYVDDVEASWMNGPDFDFVHLRNMVPILKSPVRICKQAFDHMRPGGWIELQDVDGSVHSDDNSIPEDWPLKRFTEVLATAFEKFGTSAHASEQGEYYLREAGFVNIRHNTIKLPYGTWPKDKLMRLVGMYYRTACEDFFPAVGAMHFPMLGWGQAEMEVFFAECRKSMRDPKVHAYGIMHFWSGQKPY